MAPSKPHVLCEEIRTHNSTSLWTLYWLKFTERIQYRCVFYSVPVPAWSGTVIPLRHSTYPKPKYFRGKFVSHATSCCDLNLWPMTLNKCIGCDMLNLCAKFERDRSMLGRVNQSINQSLFQAEAHIEQQPRKRKHRKPDRTDTQENTSRKTTTKNHCRVTYYSDLKIDNLGPSAPFWILR